MSWPRLLPPALCTVPAVLNLASGFDENGAPIPALRLELPCCLSHGRSALRVQDAGSQGVKTAMTALFDGDPAPGLAVLQGSVEIDGWLWQITAATRHPDPDGKINYTTLSLM